MIRPDMIPHEALEASRTAWLESASDYKLLDESIRAALALLENWSGMEQDRILDVDDDGTFVFVERIVLPILQENSND